MIRYYGTRDGQVIELDAAETGCWINIEPPFSHDELEEAARMFHVPLDFLTDSLDIDERSRYERDDDLKYILVSTAILNENIDENDAIYVTVPIGILLTPDHVLTISPFENPVLNLFKENKVRNVLPSDESMFVLQILEHNVYRFLNCLKKLNLKRNLIEKELYDSSRNRELRQLLGIEKSLVYIVNALSSNELLKMKMKRTDFLGIGKDEDRADLFEDIIIDNGQALSMANIYTNILSGTMESYASIISNNLNLVIQRLTVVTIALAVPTLVTSFFGMNVPLPFATSSWAPALILLISLLLIFSLLYFVRKSRLS